MRLHLWGLWCLSLYALPGFAIGATFMTIVVPGPDSPGPDSAIVCRDLRFFLGLFLVTLHFPGLPITEWKHYRKIRPAP